MREPPRARRLLVIAPHPDDETIGCAGLIRRTLVGGGRVDVVVVTDGTASHRASPSHPPALLAARRARETRTALAVLGIDRRGLRMLGLPDGGLDTLSVAQRGRLRRAFARYRRADLVACPDPVDAHPDHRDTAHAALRVFRDRRCLTYGVWPAGRAPRRRYALPIGSMRALKARALACHRSQLGAIRDDPGGFSVDAATRRRFLGPVERFGMAGW